MWGGTPVDIYCERLGAGLWAEPLNALTNLAFIAAAWLIWRLASRRDALSVRGLILAVLVATVGVGSGLFHTFANTLTMWLDIIPILVFQLVFLWLYFRDLIGMSSAYAAGALVVFLAAALGGEFFPEVLNGSLVYVPALIVLVILGVYHYRRRMTERGLMLLAAGVFFLSLTFRTMDASICPYVPLGTHFLWHVLNAVLLYIVSRAYLMNARPTRAVA